MKKILGTLALLALAAATFAADTKSAAKSQKVEGYLVDVACGTDTACPAGVDLNAQVLHTKLCHTAADCAGYMGSTPLGNANFDGCCESNQAPGVKFCAPTQFMGGNRYTCI